VGDQQYRLNFHFEYGTLGGLTSAALTRLSSRTIYLFQKLSFLKPADIGGRITAECEIIESRGGNRC